MSLQGRPESGRSGKRPDSRRFDDRRSEERRPNNRRDRGDSSDSSDRGRDDRYRKDNEGGRRDRRPDSRRDSRPSREPESKTKEKESLGKASDSAGKDLKPSREQDREPTNAVGKEKEKKEKETTSVTGENKPQGQESKGDAKDEKRRSDERRVRNKVSDFVTKWWFLGNMSLNTNSPIDYTYYFYLCWSGFRIVPIEHCTNQERVLGELTHDQTQETLHQVRSLAVHSQSEWYAVLQGGFNFWVCG